VSFQKEFVWNDENLSMWLEDGIILPDISFVKTADSVPETAQCFKFPEHLTSAQDKFAAMTNMENFDVELWKSFSDTDQFAILEYLYPKELIEDPYPRAGFGRVVVDKVNGFKNEESQDQPRKNTSTFDFSAGNFDYWDR
jgi:hypothetical protein